MVKITTAGALYAHAIAIEREAAERYTEFSERMEDLGNAGAAEVFARLAGLEAEHLDALLQRTEGIALPRLDETGYRWLDAGAPETAARELVFRLLSPRQALFIALDAERRAQAFFEYVLMTAADPALRALAREMAADEGEHIAMLEQMVAQTPVPAVDWRPIHEDNRG